MKFQADQVWKTDIHILDMFFLFPQCLYYFYGNPFHVNFDGKNDVHSYIHANDAKGYVWIGM